MSDGFLLIDKEVGVTSRKVDNLLQKKFSVSSVGHLGTLDPFASGLLLVAVGKATKALSFFQESTKTYVACLLLGTETTTGDKDGEIKSECDVPSFTKEQITGVLSSFLGKGKQLPPMTSAIKKDGVALYKLAHKGIEIEREERDIEIFSIKLLALDLPRVYFEVCVSSGTYIRVLGEDIAKRLGTIGHLEELRRTKIDDFDVAKAKKVDDLSETDFLDPIGFIPYPRIEVGENKKKVQNGVALLLPTDEKRVLFVNEGKAFAVYERREDGYHHCLRGLW